MLEVQKILGLNKVKTNLINATIICIGNLNHNELMNNNFEKIKLLCNSEDFENKCNYKIDNCLQTGKFAGKSKLLNNNLENISENDFIETLSDLYSCIYCIQVFQKVLQNKKKSINILKSTINKNNIIELIIKDIDKKLGKRDE